MINFVIASGVVTVRSARSDTDSLGAIMSILDNGHLEAVYGGKKGQKKRFWSDGEKRSICMQTTVPSVSVAQVARRYSMNANLIPNWLKDAPSAPEPEMDEPCCNGGFITGEIQFYSHTRSSQMYPDATARFEMASHPNNPNGKFEISETFDTRSVFRAKTELAS